MSCVASTDTRCSCTATSLRIVGALPCRYQPLPSPEILLCTYYCCCRAMIGGKPLASTTPDTRYKQKTCPPSQVGRPQLPASPNPRHFLQFSATPCASPFPLPLPHSLTNTITSPSGQYLSVASLPRFPDTVCSHHIDCLSTARRLTLAAFLRPRLPTTRQATHLQRFSFSRQRPRAACPSPAARPIFDCSLPSPSATRQPPVAPLANIFATLGLEAQLETAVAMRSIVSVAALAAVASASTATTAASSSSTSSSGSQYGISTYSSSLNMTINPASVPSQTRCKSYL